MDKPGPIAFKQFMAIAADDLGMGPDDRGVAAQVAAFTDRHESQLSRARTKCGVDQVIALAMAWYHAGGSNIRIREVRDAVGSEGVLLSVDVEVIEKRPMGAT